MVPRKLTHISAPNGVNPSSGYTHVVLGEGRVAALAGQLPYDADGALVGLENPEAQARQVFTNMKGCLAAVGATFTDVIKLTYYVTDAADIPVILAVRDEFVDTARPPASTVVQVAALYRPELLLEVDALAIVGDRTPEPTRPAPPLDRELKEPMRAVLADMPSPLTPELIPDRRRRSAAGRLSDDEVRRGGAFETEEVRVPRPQGEISLLVCRPTASPGPHGVVYHLHGGGMVAGSDRSTELVGDLRRAEELQLAVVSVDYRLAPENPDPVPVEDCYAGLAWIADNAEALGLDRDRVVLSGVSAGGALAAGLALMARELDGPRVLGQMLLFPMLDDRCDTLSMAQLERTGLWDGHSNRTGWTALLGDRRGGREVSCYAAPTRASDLAGLPPAYLEVGAVEALRDETIAYASRIWEVGGDAELHVWSGAFHCFDEWVPQAAVSHAAHDARKSWLRRLLGSAATPV